MAQQVGGKMQEKGVPRAQPSVKKEDNPVTSKKGVVPVKSVTAEKAEGRINPASPADTGTTPGSVAEEG
jgi:hypothetical protein